MVHEIDSKIINAAKILIFTFGAKGWNMNDCANEAGITKKTLYKYINSKELLIQSVLISFIEETQNQLKIIIDKERDYLQGLNKIISGFTKIIKKLDSRVIDSIFKEYPQIENTIIEGRYKLASVIIQYLKRGQDVKLIKTDINPYEILDILQAIVIYNLKIENNEVEKKISNSFNLVLNGILEK